ncbi:hypothetical protein MMC25_002272 [Agyrium rufum]|nr:hypothetical protein [Agyrium rufum]
MVQDLPGRPGNLTKEQELKLREFWKAVLQVFGVSSSHSGVPAHITAPNGAAAEVKEPEGPSAQDGTADSANLLSPDKAKKKRLGFLRRGKKDKDGKDTDDASQHSPSPSVIGDSQSDIDTSDDKYGQTKDFQQALASLGPSSLRSAFWTMVKHDHPDGLLLRFLRARKWDVEKALVMLVSTMHWRLQEMHVDDDIVKRGEGGAFADSQVAGDNAKGNVKKEGEDFLAQLRLGKSFIHGTDVEGRPICIVRVKLHKAGEQSEASLERYTVYVIETARMMLNPPVDTAAILFDMTGFSMANMDYAPVKFMIRCFEANYPESLGVVLVHKAPWVFQGIWAIIRGWLDPVVASKVHFTKTPEDLQQFVPKEHLMKDMGGTDPYSWDFVEPRPGENDLLESGGEKRKELEDSRAAMVEEWEELTRKWIAGEIESPQAIESRNQVAVKLKSNYWILDPYIRAKTVYDRIGIIKAGGKLEFYPDEKKDLPTEKKGLANDKKDLTIEEAKVQAPQQASTVETSAEDLD